MRVPVIGQLLLNSSNKSMSQLPIVVDAIRLSSNITVSKKMKAGNLYQMLKEQDPEVLELTIQEALNPGSRSKWRGVMSIVMSLMLIFMALTVCYTNVYIAITKGQQIDWDSVILCFSCPILIVLHDRGLLRKENKDMLLALLGKPPIPTFGEAITQRYSRPREDYVDTTRPPVMNEQSSGKGDEDKYGY